jgi:predicted RNase H-like nuclease
MADELYGVDGCRGGWIVARSDSDLRGVSFARADDLRSLFDAAGPHAVIAIDIPIGLPVNEPRFCDRQARQLLGLRRSTVFSPPARPVLCATSYPAALRLNRQVLGIGISKQAFYIMRKIGEVDAAIDCKKQRYVRESHPEVTFTQLNGRPMEHSKKTAAGRRERLAVLERFLPFINDEWLARERSKLRRTGPVAADDLVDALACLVTAFHIRTGRCKSLGRADQTDSNGLLMEIVTCA